MGSFEKSILVVDDEAGIRFALSLWFKQYFNTFETGEFDRAVFIAENQLIDIAVLDIRLKGDKTGLQLFKRLKQINPDMIVVLITGYGEVKDAVQAIKEGAHDYILKPIDNAALLASIRKGLQGKELKQSPVKTSESARDIPHTFNTNSKEMLSVKHRADKAKNSNLPILITGESGVGKEVLSRYIHYTSERQSENFVAVNCAAISETLLLSELFGHEKGAFTGANARKIGRFEHANNGTLFMDEVGDMSLANQAMLLRVLETQSFERLGGNETIHVNVRVITATNKDLKKMVEEGRYREDLYYRINVVNFHIPPLRERKEDIPILIRSFTDQFRKTHQKTISGYSDEAMDSLLEFPWPGNIRELANVINQVLLFSEGDVITSADLEAIRDFKTNSSSSFSNTNFTKLKSIKEVMTSTAEEQEKNLIIKALIKNGFNQSKTAKELQISRRTLFRKIHKYQIDFNKSVS